MIFSRLTNILFPSLCLQCGAELEKAGVLCTACFENIPRAHTFFCGQCAARLPEGKKICHRAYPYILASPCHYNDPAIRAAIVGLKFYGARAAAGSLGDIVARYASTLIPDAHEYVAIPVPLSRQRIRERGFNQAELLAKKICEAVGCTLRINTLYRRRHTKAQTELGTIAEREQNVQGCFTVLQAEDVSGKKIFLVDDVTTTGATLREAALELKKYKPKTIIALVAARA